MKTLSDAGCRVIAEGRYHTPAQAADAMRHGAWAVTVGSAITRLEHHLSVVQHSDEKGGAMTTLAIDIGGTKLAAALIWR
ncbi:N-acetylmannosamine-6-phosphate 2-epimerase [Escherichia coli]|uniref:N-acylglucosamine-6-phosphate 2-epimerase n=1 Tax=Escherichia coli TaxID=562 RepID=A0A376LC71_ECOLX|nr:N-acetylmannosamine-6-phosphate 2-epimerase [Escherichia coli]